MNATVEKYRKPDGYETRYWSVMVNGNLLAVTVYRNGARAVADALNQTSKVEEAAKTYTIKNP
jgi:hypothetical protein